MTRCYLSVCNMFSPNIWKFYRQVGNKTLTLQKTDSIFDLFTMPSQKCPVLLNLRYYKVLATKISKLGRFTTSS